MLRALPHVARPPPPAGSPSATPVAAWDDAWRARLPLGPIEALLSALLPRVHGVAPSALRAAIRKSSLIGDLPPPPPISVRWYQSSELSELWFTQVLWGIVYSRNQSRVDPTWVKLVQIVQIA
tara:strand:+ start:91 stop:459 length:369 start_codon:yes stop_codon:yes gene_type:complete